MRSCSLSFHFFCPIIIVNEDSPSFFYPPFLSYPSSWALLSSAWRTTFSSHRRLLPSSSSYVRISPLSLGNFTGLIFGFFSLLSVSILCGRSRQEWVLGAGVVAASRHRARRTGSFGCLLRSLLLGGLPSVPKHREHSPGSRLSLTCRVGRGVEAV